MKYQLSKREKILLYVLLCVVIVLGGWFFLAEPALSEHTRQASQLETKRLELASLENEYISYRDAGDDLEDENSKYTELGNRFFAMMNSEDVDRLLTELALRNNVTPVSLNIGAMSESSVNAYLSASDEDSASEESDTSGIGLLYEVPVTMSVSGDFNAVFAMCDEIRNETSYRVQGMTYSASEDDEASEMEIRFTIYMLNK